MNTRHIQFYITAETPCGYYSEKKSQNLVPDPRLQLNMPLYNQLIQHGFRRSGAHTYRPHCNGCQACIACRIPVDLFVASRSQKRCLKNNQDLTLSVKNATFTQEYFELYQRYLNSRHIDGSMADPDEEDFKQFLYCDWSDTQFLELRQNGKLLAVAVTDMVSDGISAVYSFFDPAMANRSLGTCCILKQINHAREQGLQYVYLGYWIENHPKMHYKNNFKPMQLYLNGQWQANS